MCRKRHTSQIIANTILEKVASTDVLAADVSIIHGKRRGSSDTEPNVLIELGYALGSLGDARTVLLMNDACTVLNGLLLFFPTRIVAVQSLN
jgi:predicted nucleotide-binding protein